MRRPKGYAEALCEHRLKQHLRQMQRQGSAQAVRHSLRPATHLLGSLGGGVKVTGK